MMDAKYADMHAMLQSNHEAWRYFNGLPDYVRDQISTRASNVCTYESLRNYADNLLSGDR